MSDSLIHSLTLLCLTVSLCFSIPFENQSNILQADFPRSTSPNVLQFKPILLLKSLEPFATKLNEVTLLLDWPDVEGGADSGSIKLKSFDQQPIPNNMHTGGQQLIEQPVNTETSIPPAQLDKFVVSTTKKTKGWMIGE